ncbi:ATP-binding protein [Yaniella halotolerans]|uniref:ATP-binding protein n=1 Tax=Yaniella halotolerans TaxID=225453 RepID=UPI0003B75630|nr:SbcC/MukB-like Walker B domain-containing protein [Yaniella halotolerans]
MTTPTTIYPGQWRMDKIEVLNWGTFQNHWDIPLSRQGFLITGPSGSGKSSLLDAVSSVLVPRNQIRFNAAAQEGVSRGPHARSLVSYVRGAYRRATDVETGEVVSTYLREQATYSGVKLSFSNGIDPEPVVLIKLYYLRRGATQNADVQEQSIILRDDRKLTDFGQFIDSGINVRQLKREIPEAELITDRHATFANRFRRMLKISGENALRLLHRTQSAKSLGNLDELFRSFMLDEPKTFQLAETAREQFQELSQAHSTVVDAREQRDVLQALREPAEAYDKARSDSEHAAYLLAGLDDYTALTKHALVTKEIEDARLKVTERRDAFEIAERRRADTMDDHNLATQQLLEAGGGALQTLESRVAAQQELVLATQQTRNDLQQRLLRVSIELPYTQRDFEELRTQAAHDITNATQRREELQRQMLDIGTQRGQNEQARKNVQAELRSLQESSSNMSLRLQQARKIIAAAAGLPEMSLPFAGELMEVREEYRDWTGAIERVLRPFATTLLIPQAHANKVLAAIDSQHLGTRVVSQVVPASDPSPRALNYPDSVVNRVTVADHAMQPWIYAELTHRYDYQAVEQASDFGNYQRAVTRAGQVRRGANRYEKDDRHNINDATHWVMGFTNNEKHDRFSDQLQQLTTEDGQLEQRLDKIVQRQNHEQRRLHLLEDLETIRWEAIDVVTTEMRRDELQAKLVELQSSNTDLIEAQRRVTEAASRKAAAEKTYDEKLQARMASENHLQRLTEILDELDQQIHKADVADDVTAELDALFLEVSETRRIAHDKLDRVSRQVLNQLHKQQHQAERIASDAGSKFQGIAQEFRTRWEAIAANLSVFIDDRAGYKDLLDRIISDGPSRFEERFFELLQTQSRNNIANLASEIRGNLGRVQDRIAPINASLSRSEFNPNTYLNIVVLNNQNEKAREFLSDLHEISSGSWAEQDRASAESRFHTMNSIMQKIGSSEPADHTWRRQVLDTRYHVRFRAKETDGAGTEVDAFDSSDGLSGGQQQKLVTFCLAAALRYQLAGVDADVPGFATVMMDEAFDKADSRFTRLAMDIFQEFGFHMVLATPLKLLETLDDYIDGTAVISIEDSRKSRVSLVTADAPGEPGQESDRDQLPMEIYAGDSDNVPTSGTTKQNGVDQIDESVKSPEPAEPEGLW